MVDGQAGLKTDAEVARGVYRFGSDRVNWYVVKEDGALLLIDAGLPAHWEQFREAITALGYGLDDVAALVLTHAHPDHVGFAERLRETAGVPVYVHEGDRGLATGTGPGFPRGSLSKLLRPAFLGLVYELARDGGFSVPDLTTVETYTDGDILEVPGTPTAIHVPGHTAGSCALWLPDREALFCGDALATYDLGTGRATQPQLLPLYDDESLANKSLDRLENLGPVTLLPGHGDSWTGDVADAIRAARRR